MTSCTCKVKGIILVNKAAVEGHKGRIDHKGIHVKLKRKGQSCNPPCVPALHRADYEGLKKTPEGDYLQDSRTRVREPHGTRNQNSGKEVRCNPQVNGIIIFPEQWIVYKALWSSRSDSKRVT